MYHVLLFINIKHNIYCFFRGGIWLDILIQKENGKFIGSIDGFWFVESGNTKDELMFKLATALKDFAVDYCKDSILYKQTPDFNSMFPLMKKIIKSDLNYIISTFNYRFEID